MGRWIQQYNIHHDNDGSEVYIPFDMKLCPECRGRGKVRDYYASDDEPEYEPCFDCDETGYVECEREDEAMSYDEVLQVEAQLRWLTRRYGRHDVRHIADYWTKAPKSA